MKTTLDLPDDLLAEAKAVAARRRTTLKAIVEHALRREISQAQDKGGAGPEARVYEVDGDGLPFFKARGTPVTSEMIHALINEEYV